MTINIEYEAEEKLDLDYEKIITDVVNEAVDYEKCPYEAEVNLLLTDDAGARLAYAWQVVLPGQRTALLDYFAVRYDLRGSGVGTAALGLVRDYDAMRVHDLVLECEPPAEAPDPSIARRRIGFYLRAGARATALESRVFGTRYAVLALPCGGTVPDAALCKELRTLYKVMVPHPYYRGQVIFYGS